MSGLEILAIVIGLAALGLLLKQTYALNQKTQKIQAKATSLEDENVRLLTTESELSSEVKRLQDKNARLSTTQSELSSEAKRLQTEVNHLTAENQDLKKLSLTLENLDVAKAELEQANVNLTQRKRDKVNLEKQISQSEGQLKKLRLEEESLKSIHTETHEAKISLEEQKTSLNHVIFSLQRKKEKTQNDCDDLKTQLDSIEDQCEQGRQRLKYLSEEKQRIDLQIKELEEYKDLLVQEHEEYEKRNETLKHISHSMQSNDELIREQNELLKALERIESEKNKLSDQVSQTREQSRQHYEALRRIHIISACHQHSTSDQELFHAKLTLGFNRVREALDFAETMFGDVLEIWDSARISADTFNFIRPDDAYRTLQSLAWFGQYYFEQNGAIGNNIYHVLRERYNLECTPEAKNVLNNKKLRDERCFWHGSQHKEMFDHLKLGGGNGADNILRIYFAINSESQKIEIGHCGKHPSN